MRVAAVATHGVRTAVSSTPMGTTGEDGAVGGTAGLTGTPV